MPLSDGSITIEDYNGEKSITNVNLQDLDAAGSNFGSISQDLDEIKDGILAVVIGQVRHTTLTFKYPESAAPVTNVQAAREGKWLVTYKDQTQYLGPANTINNPGYGKLFTFEIPCANRALLSGNTDELDLSAGAGATLRVALIGDPTTAPVTPGNIRSPFNRAASVVNPPNELVSVKYVGRNN